MQIRREQALLTKERNEIEKMLESTPRLKKLIREELILLREKFGGSRLSPLIARKEAQAMKETEILPAESITIILSNKGWVRAAKGHEIDPLSLSYKAGDAFQAAAMGRSNQMAVFLDSTGRTYSIPAHTLPSARGQGEPLTGKLTPPVGAEFVSVIIGEADQIYVWGSDAGYGFIVNLGELYGKNRGGKAVLSVPKGGRSLKPKLITNLEKEWLAVVSNTGNLLIFALKELPVLIKGKGNKMMGILSSKLASHEEYVTDMAVLNETQSLSIVGDGKPYVLKPSDWRHYRGARSNRGNKLPRGCRLVKELIVIS